MPTTNTGMKYLHATTPRSATKLSTHQSAIILDEGKSANFQRKNAYKSTARDRKVMENRSLELRQASCESGKKACYEVNSQKRLPRLWKQTTPMSQAIIHNHLEQQISTNVSSAGSPLLRELTVPSFGFDSGEGSILHSLEENPQEDLLSLRPPVSTQRRFSDNPLTVKTCAYAYQVEGQPKLTYSSQHLAPQTKLQSAPVRSFCCLFHRQYSLCDPCGQRSKTPQLPAAGHIWPHWSDSVTETSRPFQQACQMCTHNFPNTDGEVAEGGTERMVASPNRLRDRSKVQDIEAAMASPSAGYGYQSAPFTSRQAHVNRLDFDDWTMRRTGGVAKTPDSVPLSNRPLSSGSFSLASANQAGREACESPNLHMMRTRERASRLLCRGRLAPSRSNSGQEETRGFVPSNPSPSAQMLDGGERGNDRLQNLSGTLLDIQQCHTSELDVRPRYNEQALSTTELTADGVNQDEAEACAVFATPMQRLIPPDLIFSPASRRVSAVDINDAVEAPGDMQMLTVSSPRQLSRQNSIHSIEDMAQLADSYLAGSGAGGGGFEGGQSLTPQSSLSSDRIFLKPQYAATPPELQRRFLMESNAQYYGVTHARSFDQFGRQVSSDARQHLHSAQPSPIRVGCNARASSTFHRAASHSPTLNLFDHQRSQGDDLEPPAAQSPPALRTQLEHKSEVDIFGQRHLRYLRRRIQGGQRSSPNSQAYIRMTQFNSDENGGGGGGGCGGSGGSPRLLSPSEPTSSHGPTDVGSSCRTPEFFSLDSSNSDPAYQQDSERPPRETRQYARPGSSASPCVSARQVREGLQSVYCLSAGGGGGGFDRTVPPGYRCRYGNRPLDRTAVSLTTSADCLTTERINIGRLSTAHLGPSKGEHPHHYTPTATTARRHSHLPFTSKTRGQRMGDELHPRKSLEVVSAWSASCSPSTPSSRFSSRRESVAKKLGISKALSSEVDGKEDQGSYRHMASDKRRQSRPAVETAADLQQQQTNRPFRRDYTIDAKTDQLFQAFLQHDPSLDKTCIP